MKVKVGDKVAKGSVVVVVEGSAPAAAAPAQAAAAAPAPKAEAPAPAAPAAALEDANLKPGQLPHASPSVRKFARAGREPEQGQGLRSQDRITADDVRAFVKQALAAPAAVAGGSADGAALGLLPWPKVDFTKFGPIELPLSRIKKISGANLHRTGS